jgi:hypothetical protein
MVYPYSVISESLLAWLIFLFFFDRNTINTFHYFNKSQYNEGPNKRHNNET